MLISNLPDDITVRDIIDRIGEVGKIKVRPQAGGLVDRYYAKSASIQAKWVTCTPVASEALMDEHFFRLFGIQHMESFAVHVFQIGKGKIQCPAS